MDLSFGELVRMMDLSAVRAESDETEVRAMADWARRYRCVAVFALPAMTELLCSLLKDETDIAVGGVVGFPSGGSTTAIKVREAEELLAMGCRELDMVINIGKLRSGRIDEVSADIRAVVETAGSLPVKVIFECHYLNDEQIRQACACSEAGGAAFVKTGTGWAQSGATVANVGLMKSCVGDRLGVKAAGGVRDLETLHRLHRAGATRFGIGLSSALAILAECERQP
ncbi:MAG: deoxyribose-phosphate aldolase [Spirochaetota bacterium]